MQIDADKNKISADPHVAVAAQYLSLLHSVIKS